MLTPVFGGDQPGPLNPDRAHPLVHAESALRCARFYLAVWEAGGSMELAIKRLGGGTANSDSPAGPWQSLSPANPVPRSTIATWLSAAYSPHLATLALPIRLHLTGQVASLFGRIGYARKEAFVLRELAALCAEGVAKKGSEVQTTVESVTSGSLSAVGEEEGPRSDSASAAASASAPPPAAASIVRTTSDSAGNDSIIKVAEKVCQTFGVDTVPRNHSSKRARQKAVVQSWNTECEHFGWPALQIGVLKDSISIAEALPGERMDEESLIYEDCTQSYRYESCRLSGGYSLHGLGPQRLFERDVATGTI